MKNPKRIIAFVAMLAMVAVACFALVACGEKPGDKDIIENVTFSAPEGTPALAMLRLATDNAKIGDISVTYKVVKPANIAAEMSAKRAISSSCPSTAAQTLLDKEQDTNLSALRWTAAFIWWATPKKAAR